MRDTTVEEKREKVNKYCNSKTDRDCIKGNCALNNSHIDGNCIDENNANEEQLDRALALIRVEESKEVSNMDGSWRYCEYLNEDGNYNNCKGCDDEKCPKWSKVIRPVNDSVNHPDHYQGAHECIDVMVAMFGVEAVMDFCRCNAYKYRFRADSKGSHDEDIKKAEWYEGKLIELLSEVSE